MRFFLLNTSILFLAALSGGPSANAAVWQSSDYYCQVTLPDGSYVQQWFTMSPANENGALTGARRQDFGAIVYLGVVDVKDKPHFKLDDKSLKELEQGYFGPGLGFLHETKPISLGGIKGYRLTGRHRFNGRNYGIVVDMYFDHGLVYQVAGLSELYDNPLQDSDVRAYMQSFRILPE
jgi:hypothetical protein